MNFTIDVKLNDRDHSLDAFAKIEYINNSPDTLHYIWFHIWPNAYKNDKTAFSDQLLENGNKNFYFSENNQRGYINRLDFLVEGTRATMEDHPQHIDIIKVILPNPLAPGSKVQLETPFHVKLPHVFSRSGHYYTVNQITQWYPKPAVYDKHGWHPMPYLDQGEFYSEFGNYDVRISVPDTLIVAATGELKEEETVSAVKTVRYVQENVHDFAWFADKFRKVQQDTIQLPSGRVIKAFFYFRGGKFWDVAMRYLKDAVRFRSAVIGEYPYSTVKVVEGTGRAESGMEYPTITYIVSPDPGLGFDFLIEHEVGHNWFYGILASNERDHPWMDEGMNSYYDLRFMKEKYGNAYTGMIKKVLWGDNFVTKRFPPYEISFGLDAVYAVKNDQPITTSSEAFTEYNYNIIAYMATAHWMEQLESHLGREVFDKAMKAYYEEWKFKHPTPEDFRKTIETVSGKDLSAFFDQLNK
ncbi:MAG TPA: M1 family metallopeptidase, partial [Chitinophagaceae bacterium]